MSDPSVVIKLPGNNWRSDNKLYTLPSLDIFPGGISLEVNINPRRGGNLDYPLHPLLGLHLQTLTKEAESQKDPNFLTRKGEENIRLLHYLIISPMAAQNLSKLQPAEITNVHNLNRLYNALQRTRVQTLKLKPGPLIGQSMKFSGSCPWSYAQGQPRSMLQQSLYLALNT